jgi:hypothetical protein
MSLGSNVAITALCNEANNSATNCSPKRDRYGNLHIVPPTSPSRLLSDCASPCTGGSQCSVASAPLPERQLTIPPIQSPGGKWYPYCDPDTSCMNYTQHTVLHSPHQSDDNSFDDDGATDNNNNIQHYKPTNTKDLLVKVLLSPKLRCQNVFSPSSTQHQQHSGDVDDSFSLSDETPLDLGNPGATSHDKVF